MFWYKGKKVTLDLVIGLAIGVMALGTVDSPHNNHLFSENNLKNLSEQIISFNKK
jgi:hypothetical protein